MSDDRNEDTCRALFDEKNLEFIYSTSKDAKNEASKAITDNTDLIIKILNLLLVFMGIYVTILVFVFNQNKSGNLQIPLPGLPVIFSGIF